MKALDLRGKRQSMDIRIEALASEIGVHNNTLTDIERGRIGIDQDTYNGIVAAIERLSCERSEREEVSVA